MVSISLTGVMLLIGMASTAATQVSEALYDLCFTAKSFLGASLIITLILAIPLIAAGLFLYLKKKESKNLMLLGIALIVIGIALPAIAAVLYFLTPLIISSLIGGGASVSC